LENLEETVIKVSEDMQILDEKLFPSYQKGRKEGRQEGRKEGIEKGLEKARRKAALSQLRRGKLTDEEIAEDFELSLEVLAELKKQIEKDK
jgi:predicted transposase YdaD